MPLSDAERQKHREGSFVRFAKATGYKGAAGRKAREIEAKRSASPTSTTKEGESPYEKYYEKKDASGRSESDKFIERVKTAEKHAPEELKEAFETGSSQKLEQAIETGVARKVEARGVALQKQSAVADLQQAGLIQEKQRIVAGQQQRYYALTPKGQGLGAEKIYKLEKGAVWGESVDFLVTDDEFYVLPEGTRSTIKKAGMDRPRFIEHKGKTFLLTEKEGTGTLKAKEYDPVTGFYKPEEKEIRIQSILLEQGQPQYAFTPDFDYKLTDEGLELASAQEEIISSTPVSAPSRSAVSRPIVPKGATQAEAIELMKQAGKSQKQIAPWEIRGDEEIFISHPGVAESQLTSKGLFKTPLATFYETDYIQPVTKAIEEKETETGLYVDTPIGEIRPASMAVGFVGGAAEFSLKTVVAGTQFIATAGLVGINEIAEAINEIRTERSLKNMQELPTLSKEHKLAIASDFGSSLTHLSALPFTVAFVMVGAAGKPKITTVDLAGKPIAAAAKQSGFKTISTTISPARITREFAGGGFQVIPRGHPAFYRELVSAGITKVGTAASTVTSPLAPAGRIASEAINWGLISAGVQVGADLAVSTRAALQEPVQKPEIMGPPTAREQTFTYQLIQPASDFLGRVEEEYIERGGPLKAVGAFFGGALVGGTIGITREIRPVVSDVFKGAKRKIVQAPKETLQVSFQSIDRMYRDAKVYQMTSRTPRETLKRIQMQPDAPLFIPTQLTIIGVNPLSAIYRPQRESVVTQISQPVSRFRTPREAQPIVPRVRQTFKLKLKQREPFAFVSTGVFEPPKMVDIIQTKRLEGIEQDIAFEAGRTKAEQVEAIKQRAGLGIRTLSSFRSQQRGIQRGRSRVATGLITLEDIGIAERIIVPQQFKLAEKVKVPERQPTEAPILIPSFDIFGEDDKKKRRGKKDKKGKPKYAYSPSVAGIGLGTKKVLKKVYTGLEIRGIA